MSREKIFGDLISTMILCLLLTGVFKCGHYLYTTVTDVIVVEQPNNIIDLPSYSVEGENNANN